LTALARGNHFRPIVEGLDHPTIDLRDDLLRKVFTRLPQKVQDALHGRLYPKQ